MNKCIVLNVLLACLVFPICSMNEDSDSWDWRDAPSAHDDSSQDRSSEVSHQMRAMWHLTQLDMSSR